MTDAEKNKTEKGVLYLVATPIGNLDDITLRAVKVLRECDFIAAEDTRVTSKLLARFDISKPVIIYEKHSVRESGSRILERVRNGETCALVTDAGTPGISDPGQEVAGLLIENGITVRAVPGACAAITALVTSGMPTDGFVFIGFPGSKKPEMEKNIGQLVHEKRTAVLYEAPHRLKKTLGVMSEILGGERKIALCRELTKINEEIIRTTVAGAISKYSSEEPRGEYVIVVSGCGDDPENAFWSGMTLREHIDYYTGRMGLDRMAAVKAVARDRDLPKNEVYKELIT